MPGKSTSTKRRTNVKDIAKETKALSGKEQKRIKGGLLPYVEQDNLRKPSSITDGTSKITDGTSNIVVPK